MTNISPLCRRKLPSILARNAKHLAPDILYTPYRDQEKNSFPESLVDLQPTIAKTHVFDTCGGVPVPMRFVSEVLSLILSDNENEIRVQLSDFLWDRKDAIETTSLLTVEITSENIVETMSKIEVTLLGTACNQQGKRTAFTVYFFMRRHCHGPVPSKEKCIISLPMDILNICCEEKMQHLSNAVFNLIFSRKSTSLHGDVLGAGRGFLFVGPGQGIMVG